MGLAGQTVACAGVAFPVVRKQHAWRTVTTLVGLVGEVAVGHVKARRAVAAVSAACPAASIALATLAIARVDEAASETLHASAAGRVEVVLGLARETDGCRRAGQAVDVALEAQVACKEPAGLAYSA